MKRTMCVLAAAVFFTVCAGMVTGQDSRAYAAEKKGSAKSPVASLKRQTVVAVNPEGNTLTLKDKSGSERELALTGSTVIKKGKVKLGLADLAAGETVTVYFKKAKNGQDEPSTIKVVKAKR